MISSLLMMTLCCTSMVAPLSMSKTNSSNGVTLTLDIDPIPHLRQGTDVTEFTLYTKADVSINVTLMATVYTATQEYGDYPLKSFTYPYNRSSTSFSVYTRAQNVLSFKDFDFASYVVANEINYLKVNIYNSSETTLLYSFTGLSFGDLSDRLKVYQVYQNRAYNICGGSLSLDYEVLDFTNSSFALSKGGQYIDQPLEFTYDTWYKGGFTSDNMYLEVYDPNNAFPYIDKDRNNIFTIPYVNQNDIYAETISLVPNLSSSWYVNPYTLEMSNKARSGFTRTYDKFYFPNNKNSEELSACKFTLKVDCCTGNDIDLQVIMKYQSETSYFGNCQTSDYCVTGGRKNA